MRPDKTKMSLNASKDFRTWIEWSLMNKNGVKPAILGQSLWLRSNLNTALLVKLVFAFSVKREEKEM